MENQRIALIDALRGFALSGILILHSIEHFSFMQPAEMSPQLFTSINPYVELIIQFLFKGKAFTIFSLLFGFSFFTLMNNSSKKGIDFSRWFTWRLIILLVFGYLFSAILLGEILTIYALLGLPLIFFYRFNTKTLIVIGLVLIAQIPTILNWVLSFWSFDYNPDLTAAYMLFGEAFETYANGSLLDVVKFNLWKGHVVIIQWAFFEGKLIQTFGLFVLGLALGKSGVLLILETYIKKIRKALILSVSVFVCILIVGQILPISEGQPTDVVLISELLPGYHNLMFSLILILSFTLFYLKMKDRMSFSMLTAFGKMSLTNYVVQPLIGVPLFYGFGLGLYNYFGPTLSLLTGSLILVFQYYFSGYWSKNFRYGPLEWCWRACTYLSFKIPFKSVS